MAGVFSELENSLIANHSNLYFRWRVSLSIILRKNIKCLKDTWHPTRMNFCIGLCLFYLVNLRLSGSVILDFMAFLNINSSKKFGDFLPFNVIFNCNDTVWHQAFFDDTCTCEDNSRNFCKEFFENDYDDKLKHYVKKSNLIHMIYIENSTHWKLFSSLEFIFFYSFIKSIFHDVFCACLKYKSI